MSSASPLEVADPVDPITRLCMRALALEEDAAQVLELDWHPLRPLLVAADVQGGVNVWQVAKPTPRRPRVHGKAERASGHSLLRSLDHHTASVRSLVFSPTDGAHLFTGSADRSLVAIDMETLQVAVKRADAHAAGINKLCFYDEHLLVSGDDDGFVNIWDNRQAQAAGKMRPQAVAGAKPALRPILHYQDAGDYISDIYPLREKNRLFMTSGDGHLYVYDMRIGHIHEMLSGKGAKTNAKAKAKGSKKSESGARVASGAVVDTWFAMSDDVEDELAGVLPLKNGKKIVVAGREEGVLNIFKYDFFGVAEDHFSLGSAANDTEGSGASIDCMIKVDEDTVITGSTDGLIRLVQVHPNKLIAILGTHEDFPIECIRMSPPKPDYFDTARAEPESEKDDDDDEDGPSSEFIKTQPEEEESSSGLIPRFLASSSHDQTIKFWNTSELYEVDPDEVREDEEDSSDEDMAGNGSQSESASDSSDEEVDEEKKAAIGAKVKAAIERKRKREAEEAKSKPAAAKSASKPSAAAAKLVPAAAAKNGKAPKPAAATKGDTSSDEEDDEDGAEFDSEDMSDSSQLDGPRDSDDEEMGEDDGEDGEDDDEEEEDLFSADLHLPRPKRSAPLPVSDAWASAVIAPAASSAATAAAPSVPSFLTSANPFAMPGANPFVVPGVNPFAMPVPAAAALSAAATVTPTPSPAAAAAPTAATPAPAAKATKVNPWLKLAPVAASAAPAAASSSSAAAAAPASKPSAASKLAAKIVPAAKGTPAATAASAKAPSAAARIMANPSASPIDISDEEGEGGSEEDSDEERARKRSKTDLNAATGFFQHLPVSHPMHPSQAHKRATKGGLKVEHDNIHKRVDKKRVELQERLAARKAKRDRLEVRRAQATAEGRDPDLESESEGEEILLPQRGKFGGKNGKGGKNNSLSRREVDSDEDSDADSDAEGGAKPAKPVKEKKLTAKEKKALKLAEKKRNPFFGGL